MKLIVAIIRPEKLDDVRAALESVLDEGDRYRLTVQQVEGHGRQRGRAEYFRGKELPAKLVAKTQVTIAVNDQYVEKTVQAILNGARTSGGGAAGTTPNGPPEGAIGDGKIFVLPLEQCIRIRTGERGGKAI